MIVKPVAKGLGIVERGTASRDFDCSEDTEGRLPLSAVPALFPVAVWDWDRGWAEHLRGCLLPGEPMASK